MTDAVRRNIERHGIQFMRGEARLGADRTIQVTGDAGDERLLWGNVALIVTDRSPSTPQASHLTTRTCTTRPPDARLVRVKREFGGHHPADSSPGDPGRRPGRYPARPPDPRRRGGMAGG
jgi:hypothetical protein